MQPIIVLLLTLCEAALAQGRPRPRHPQPHMTVLEQEAFQELMVAGRLAGPGGTVTRCELSSELTAFSSASSLGVFSTSSPKLTMSTATEFFILSPTSVVENIVVTSRLPSLSPAADESRALMAPTPLPVAAAGAVAAGAAGAATFTKAA